MGYGLIAIFAGVALSVWYVFATEASWVGKGIVMVMLGISLICIFHATRFSSFGFILLIALGLYVALYKAYLES